MSVIRLSISVAFVNCVFAIYMLIAMGFVFEVFFIFFYVQHRLSVQDGCAIVLLLIFSRS